MNGSSYTGQLSPSTLSVIFKTIVKLAEFDRKYKNVFREVGLLDMIIRTLKGFACMCLCTVVVCSR